MAEFAERLTDLLIPPYARRYWTFRNATVVVLLVTVATACVHALAKFPAEYVARVEPHNAFRSPLFIALYYVFVSVVLWLVYATRKRAKWYQLRVFVFAMFLAGGLIGLVDILLPLRLG
jgi:hypothetical protein